MIVAILTFRLDKSHIIILGTLLKASNCRGERAFLKRTICIIYRITRSQRTKIRRGSDIKTCSLIIRNPRKGGGQGYPCLAYIRCVSCSYSGFITPGAAAGSSSFVFCGNVINLNAFTYIANSDCNRSTICRRSRRHCYIISCIKVSSTNGCITNLKRHIASRSGETT